VALDTKWLHAQLNLAFKVVAHYLKKLWPWAPRYGLQRFQENYVVEGLPPATLSFRESAAKAGQCTTCGACDRACPLLVTRNDFVGPMALVVTAARAAPHLEHAKATLAILTSETCTSCRRCEPACPEDIPIVDLAAHLQAQLDVVDAARAGRVPISGPEATARAQLLLKGR
jgi:succinate dehydrogenase/fumarate reductase-like Fe-S protein